MIVYVYRHGHAEAKGKLAWCSSRRPRSRSLVVADNADSVGPEAFSRRSSSLRAFMVPRA